MKESWVLAMVALVACHRYGAPTAPPPRNATAVEAPAERAWNAALQVFADNDIPILSVDRASGVIATDEVRVGDAGVGRANCGQVGTEPVYPNFARYTALVQGDSTSSSVKLAVVWTHVSEKAIVKECSTTHQFEEGFEAEVKSRAENPPSVAAAPAPPGTRHSLVPDTTNLDVQNARSKEELLANPNFSQAIGDMYRKGLVLEFREAAVERLDVDLSTRALSTPSLEYLLTRLFLAYGTTLFDATNPVVLLMANGGVIGRYSRSGLEWATPR